MAAKTTAMCSRRRAATKCLSTKWFSRGAHIPLGRRASFGSTTQKDSPAMPVAQCGSCRGIDSEIADTPYLFRIDAVEAELSCVSVG